MEMKKVQEVQPAQQSSVGQRSPLKRFSKPSSSAKFWIINILIAVIVIMTGIGSGWLLSGRRPGVRGTSTAPGGISVTDQKLGSSGEVGISDEELFPDEAEGVLEEGGIDGEGTHRLNRDLGPEKDVYLSSTVIDLQGFVGKKVKVWGQTLSGQKAGWLMDVGKVKIIE